MDGSETNEVSDFLCVLLLVQDTTVRLPENWVVSQDIHILIALINSEVY